MGVRVFGSYGGSADTLKGVSSVPPKNLRTRLARKGHQCGAETGILFQILGTTLNSRRRGDPETPGGGLKVGETE